MATVAANQQVGDFKSGQRKGPERRESQGSSSDESEPGEGSVPVSRVNSDDNLVAKEAGNNKKTDSRSLEERGKVPTSFYVTLTSIFMLEACSGMYKLETLQNWWSSITTSSRTVYAYLDYLKDLMNSAYGGELRETNEYLTAAVITAVVASLVGIFIWAPFRAGVWTGKRATRHKVHRYMGLFFLIQYALVWVEFLTNYDGGGTLSLLPHTLALNGIVQGYSAYFSFRVLPEIKDAGYYSDKGVMSRNFLHENIFYQSMCLFGSVYYDSGLRQALHSNLPGRLTELVFLFFPYVVLRPFFPTTRFRDGGTQNKSRSGALAKFYEIGTTMIKIFYLWAKYFLGFHINFMTYLGLIKPENLVFVHGLYLLNAGTCSIGVFLHTLRFKKILPAWFTFSFYLCQIYATFTALPYAFDTFVGHPKLCLVSLVGLLCNMTRNRTIHAGWCLCTMLLLTSTNIEW